MPQKQTRKQHGLESTKKRSSRRGQKSLFACRDLIWVHSTASWMLLLGKLAHIYNILGVSGAVLNTSLSLVNEFITYCWNATMLTQWEQGISYFDRLYNTIRKLQDWFRRYGCVKRGWMWILKEVWDNTEMVYYQQVYLF